MKYHIVDNQTGQIHLVDWNKPTPPTQEEAASLIGLNLEPAPEELNFDVAPGKYIAGKAKEMALGMGEGAVKAGKSIEDLVLGTSARNIATKLNPLREATGQLPETPKTGITPIDVALQETRKQASIPELLRTVQETQEQAPATKAEYAKFYGDAGENIKKDPLRPIMDISLLLGAGGMLSKAGKAKPALLTPQNAIETAEILPTNLEKTNIQNIAKNKFVRDNLKNFSEKQAPEITFEASEAIKKVKPAIRTAQSEFYKKLGIEDTDPIDVNLALAKMDNEIQQGAKFVDEQALKKAKVIFDDLIADTQSVERMPIYEKVPKKMEFVSEGTLPEFEEAITGYTTKKTLKPLTFGKVKQATQMLYDLAEDNVNDMGRHTLSGRFFKKLGDALTEAKKNDPRIKKASAEYSDLMNAEKLINKALRLNREQGEMRLENKIASSFKDKGQMTFKEYLDEIDKILGKYEESKHLVGYGGFTDKIKLAQLLNDIAAKKAITPVGMGRIPGVKMLGNVLKVGDPSFQAQLLKRGVERGIIKPEVLAGQVRNYPGLIGGKTKTTILGINKMLNLPKSKLPTLKQLSILSLLGRKKEER